MKILVINPGATSTKIAVYEDEKQIFKTGIDHDAKDLAPFEHVVDQFEYRKDLILSTLSENGYDLSDFSAVCGRGGLLKHIPSGTYQVNDAMIRDIEDVEVAVLLKEKEGANGYKASLRSHEVINVSDICMLLGGGGHRGAAGCFVSGTLEQAKNKVINAVKQGLKK